MASTIPNMILVRVTLRDRTVAKPLLDGLLHVEDVSSYDALAYSNPRSPQRIFPVKVVLRSEQIDLVLQFTREDAAELASKLLEERYR